MAQSEPRNSFLRNTIVRLLLVATLVFLGGSAAVLAFFIRASDGLVVLDYNVYFGVEIQGVWWQAFMLPLAGTLFLAGNLSLSRRFYLSGERVAAYLMLFGSCLMALGILIASGGIAFINY